jgi:hypothetical protein
MRMDCYQRSCRVSVWCHKHVSGMPAHMSLLTRALEHSSNQSLDADRHTRLDRERGGDGEEEAQQIMHAALAQGSILRWRSHLQKRLISNSQSGNGVHKTRPLQVSNQSRNSCYSLTIAEPKSTVAGPYAGLLRVSIRHTLRHIPSDSILSLYMRYSPASTSCKRL